MARLLPGLQRATCLLPRLQRATCLLPRRSRTALLPLELARVGLENKG